MEAINQATTLTVPQSAMRVIYQRRDITVHIEPALIELSYTDYLEGQSDSLELSLHDTDRRWQDAWYPEHGDVIEAALGWVGLLLPCGSFEVDEVELSGPPDVLRIKALGAGIKRAVRTKRSRSYEKTTLAEIAREVARNNGLELQGEIEAISIVRATQVAESELAFLRRLCAEWGYAFSLRGKKLCVYKRSALKAKAAVRSISRQQVSSYSWRDKVHGVYAKAELSYTDPSRKAVSQAQCTDKASARQRASADTLRLHGRAENNDHARRKAQSAMERSNEEQLTVSLSLPGNPALLAGSNVDLQGFGRRNGRYTITQARHSISRSGYSCELECRMVREEQA